MLYLPPKRARTRGSTGGLGSRASGLETRRFVRKRAFPSLLLSLGGNSDLRPDPPDLSRAPAAAGAVHGCRRTIQAGPRACGGERHLSRQCRCVLRSPPLHAPTWPMSCPQCACMAPARRVGLFGVFLKLAFGAGPLRPALFPVCASFCPALRHGTDRTNFISCHYRQLRAATNNTRLSLHETHAATATTTTK